jgi:hypothetical protein
MNAAAATAGQDRGWRAGLARSRSRAVAIRSRSRAESRADMALRIGLFGPRGNPGAWLCSRPSLDRPHDPGHR